MMFRQVDNVWYMGTVVSAVVYAGAVQFIAVGLMNTLSSYWLILLSTIFVAFRNSFYGLCVMKRFRYHPFLKFFMIFSLVDGNYAIMTSHEPYADKKMDQQFCFYVALFLYLSWVVGTLVGTLFSNLFLHVGGLEFALVAFFVILLFENYMKNKSLQPFIIAAIAGAVTFPVLPLNLVLLVAIAICFTAQTVLFFVQRD